MKRNIISALSCVMAILFNGCSSDIPSEPTSAVSSEGTILQLEIDREALSRAGISAVSFDEGDEVFVVVTDRENPEILNVTTKATYIDGTWQMADKIDLATKNKGVSWSNFDVEIYYPYQKAQYGFDKTTRKIEVENLIYNDILYGSSGGHSMDSPIVKVVCRHAMTRLTFALKNDSDREMYINKFSVKNSGQQQFLGKSGILDSSGIHVTGYQEVSSVEFEHPVSSRTTIAIVKRAPLTISAGDSVNYDFLIPPTAEEYDSMQDHYINDGVPKTVLKFEVTLFEYMYTAPGNKKVYREKAINFDIEAAAWREGHQYTYPVTLLGSSTPNPNEYVDLGLPSGTKWCTHNVGASAPEEYGGYYAWGETREKSDYSESNYEFYDDAEIDDAEISGTQYDVAHVLMGEPWCMPTLEQLKELKDYCTWQWIEIRHTDPHIETVRGYNVTGPNGGEIFLPAAGMRLGDELISPGHIGRYWTGTGNGPYMAYPIFFNNHYYNYDADGGRYWGQTVRPVFQ